MTIQGLCCMGRAVILRYFEPDKRMMPPLLKFSCTIIATFVAIYLGYIFLLHSGALSDIKAPEIGQCQKFPVAPGTEDVVADKTSGFVFVSSYDRRDSAAGAGGIYRFHIDNPAQVERLEHNGPSDFRPHGIGLWSDGEQQRLFAVNHKGSGEHTVEIFELIDSATLDHKQSVQFDEMYSPNDVQAVGPNAFYATNDRGPSRSKLSEMLGILGLPLSSIVYFDGERGRTVATGLTYANGIHQSPHGRYIYAAESTRRTVRMYERDQQSSELTLLRSLDVNQSPDNIDVDEQGYLWIAGHPDAFKYLAFSKDPAKKAPSHVMKLDPETSARTDVYFNAGEMISGSTAGISYNNKLIIGAVLEDFVLVCDL